MKNSNALVEAEWLKENLDHEKINIIEIDVSNESYEKEHIPGAKIWNIYSDIKDEKYHPRTQSEIQKLIQESGITEESTIVFYGYAPAFGYWLMSLLGHQNLYVLNTSKASWKNKNYPLTATVSEIKKGDFCIKSINQSQQVKHDELKQIFNDDGHKILDVRSELEYEGERFWPSGGIPEGARAGHIPTAVHLPIDGMVKEDGSFMNEAELKEFFSDLDLTSSKDIITYCTIGARASTVWFSLSQILGVENVRVYDGSWTQWGVDPSIETRKKEKAI